jgi:hypothetical protein
MNKKQIFALFIPLLVLAIMYPIFQILGNIFSENMRLGWFIGLTIYWLIFGLITPLCLIGKKNILKLIKPRKLTLKIILFISIPAIILIINKFFPVMIYEKPTLFVFSLLLLSGFGNGFFEEVLWRGVYMNLFSNNIFFRIIFPSIGFGLWHYAPGSISSSNPLVLVIGAIVLGIYLSFIAKKTGTIWWTILIHTSIGIIASIL